MKKEFKEYQLEAPDGRPVKVKYYPRYFFSKELNHRVDHFEFRGEVVSSTGFRSEFSFVEIDFKETDENVIDFCKMIIEKQTGTKYGSPAQQSLL